MANGSQIEWTDATWNPVTGCTKVSAGCANCYAERMARRLQAMGNPKYARGFEVTLHPPVLELPLTWSRPSHVFVNSMSDLFHAAVPDDFIRRVFDVMVSADWHVFQVLTKRPERARALGAALPWAPNIWLGATVESSAYVGRADALRDTPALVRFLSLEPLLTDLPDLQVEGLDWVVVGGESGPRARPMRAEWARRLRDLCQHHSVPFFFKQWGGVRKSRTGRMLDGRTWDEMPARAA